MRRPIVRGHFLVTLTAAALFYAAAVTFAERHEHAKEAVFAEQIDHVHRHLVAGCQLVEGETEATCEARWLVAVSK